MNKASSKRLLTLVEEILEQEKRAKELYEEYIRRIEDSSIVKGLRLILDDEKRHITLASEVLGLIKYGSRYSRVKNGLNKFSETMSTLISCGIENYLKVNMIVLKNLVNEKGFKCIYVAVNKPVSSLVDAFRREGVDTEKLSFIECTTVGTETEKRILVKPDNLTDVSVRISRLIRATSGRKFIYLDAISTLYVFNPDKKVERFAHHLVSNARLKRTGLILIVVNEEIENRSIAVLTTFCDNRIEL